MEIATLNTRTKSLKEKRAKDIFGLKLDLPELIKKMKRSNPWIEGELISLILLNRPGKQVLLTALHEKTEVNSFQSMDSITLQIIEGKLLFHSSEESVILNEGQLLTLHEHEEYSLISLKETVFLLTISGSSVYTD
jgi:hypothetical protein